MATETKTFLSKSGLEHYNLKITAEIDAKDEETLNAAKEYAKGYADDLADNYDAAGTAATKVEELANGQVKTNKEAIEAINHTTNGILAQAKAHAEQVAAQAADGKDGAIAEAKKAGTDAQNNLTTLINGDINTMKGQIAALEEGTYDDTEVRGLIGDNADAIDAVEGRADVLETKVTTLIGNDAEKSVRTIANEELAKQLIPESAAEAMNELAEIAAWIQAHPSDAATMNEKILAVENKLSGINAGEGTVKKYIDDAITALKIGDYAKASELAALAGRVATIEGNIGTGTVDSRISTAKQEAIDTAAQDAKGKADAALETAKGYTDQEIKKIDLSGIATNAGNISTLTGRMDSAESEIGDLKTSLATGGATANAIAEAKKAGTDAQGQVTALTNGTVKSNTDRITALESVKYVEITTAEIDAMFA